MRDREAALADITFDTFGVMVSETFADGALPPYVPTSGSARVADRGLFLSRGTIDAPNSDSCGLRAAELLHRCGIRRATTLPKQP